MTAFRAPRRSCFILPQRSIIRVFINDETHTSIFKMMHFNFTGSVSYNRMGLLLTERLSQPAAERASFLS